MPAGGNKGYPSRYESRLTLKNGKEVLIRPILQTDSDLIIDIFNRISPRSTYQRFLTKLEVLSEDMLHHFTHIDYETDFALVAVVEEGDSDAVIAVARYMYDPAEDNTDLGLTVRDDWQNLGLGKTLLEMLVSVAGKHGISRFRSMMDAGNTIMEKILKDLGYEVKYSLRSGFYEVEILV